MVGIKNAPVYLSLYNQHRYSGARFEIYTTVLVKQITKVLLKKIKDFRLKYLRKFTL